jgi:hypothetical protein
VTLAQRPHYSPLPADVLRSMLQMDADATLDLDRRAALNRRLATEDARAIAMMDADGLRAMAADGHPAQVRLAAATELRRRATVYEPPF